MENYKCNNCGERFIEPDVRTTTYENHYDVDGDLYGSHPMSIGVCPHCQSEDYEETNEIDWRDISISKIMDHGNEMVSFFYEFIGDDEAEYSGYMLIKAGDLSVVPVDYLAKCVVSNMDEVLEKPNLPEESAQEILHNFRTDNFDNPIYHYNLA